MPPKVRGNDISSRRLDTLSRMEDGSDNKLNTSFALALCDYVLNLDAAESWFILKEMVVSFLIGWVAEIIFGLKILLFAMVIRTEHWRQSLISRSVLNIQRQ